MLRNRDHSDYGFVVAADTNAVPTGDYFGIQVIAAAEIDTITFKDGYEGDDGIAGIVLPAGLYRPMRFTTLTLTSGTVICERAS